MSKHIAINDIYHKRLSLVRKLYIDRYHRNIPLGIISEMLYDQDPVIRKLYDEAKIITIT